MNKIYKLKYDRRRNQVVVVSELTAGAGKENTGQVAALAGLTDMCSFRKLLGTLTPLAFLTGLVMSLLPGIALANPDLPTGGQIVAGQGSISTNGNQMTISQNTHGLVTNWNTFDVGQNHTVQFVQPDSSSVALNRVTGGHESQILGTLTANGQVMLVNPAGVMFGKGATVNTAGLVASTKNISNADFMAGHYTFSGGSDAGAEVVNQGNLTTTKGGYIVLAADRVKNSGTIRTPGGKTVLAAGDKVTLQLDNGGLTSVLVNGSVVNALVENRGLISATNGQVYLTAQGRDMLMNTVVNNSGTIEAKGLESCGGEIVLNGGDSGGVSQSGRLLADSLTGKGGKITLEGQNIHLAGNSLTSATGKTGGGEVYVGGGWQGKDSHIHNASKVVMDRSATVDVSATQNGNGGTAVLWSDDYTNFQGTILARGGAQSGNGGRVETSSHRNLQAFGAVDASARAGHGGDWLLDPTDVTIVGAGGDTGIDSSTTDGTDIFTPKAGLAKILNTSIVNQLNAGTNVTVKTSGIDTSGQSGNIAVNANIIKNTGADATLTLLADNSITTAGKTSIGSTTGKLNLNLLAGATTDNAGISLGVSPNISLNGGDFYAGAGKDGNKVSLIFKNNGKIQAGNITMNVAGGLSGYAYGLLADNNLTINGPISGSTGWGVPLTFSAGHFLTLNSPTTINLVANDTKNGGGSVVIRGGDGVSLNTDNGDINLQAANAKTNTVTVTSNGIISITSNKGAVSLGGSHITSGGGNISITGNVAGLKRNDDGVLINNTVLQAKAGKINVKGVADGVSYAHSAGGVRLSGNVTFDSTLNSIDGTHLNGGLQDSYGGVVVNAGDFNFINDTVINATGNSYAGLIFDAGYSKVNLNFQNGNSSINAVNKYQGVQSGTYGGMVIVPWTAHPQSVAFNIHGGKLNITASAITADGIQSCGESNFTNLAHNAGYVFSGDGNVSVKGVSDSGNGVELRVLDNSALTGKFVVSGESNSGTGVIVTEYANVNVRNATITGSSHSGVGIQINAADSHTQRVNLSGNTLLGISDTSTGINIHGNNVTITGGELNGTSGGNGYGVAMTGGTNYTIDGAYVTGQSANGAGVSVTGNIAFNNDANLNGSASGSGNGVSVNGSLSSDGGVTIKGSATTGSGVLVNGDTKLNNATVSGNATEGSGIEVKGNLTNANTTLEGNATGHGAGVTIGGNITGGAIKGDSALGSGVLVNGPNATVDGATISGNTSSGVGVNISGNLTNTNGTTVNGSAADGSGVTLGGNLSGGEVTGISQSGSGVDITGSVEGGAISGDSAHGTGTTVSNGSNVTNTTIGGNSSTGTGVEWGSQVTNDNVTISGNATSGTSVHLGDDTTLNNATVSGNTADG
ncbi:filamentous hemagglutinin N-terminal domain-containing protein, partial [Salmonella enterica]